MRRHVACLVSLRLHALFALDAGLLEHGERGHVAAVVVAGRLFEERLGGELFLGNAGWSYDFTLKMLNF